MARPDFAPVKVLTPACVDIVLDQIAAWMMAQPPFKELGVALCTALSPDASGLKLANEAGTPAAFMYMFQKGTDGDAVVFQCKARIGVRHPELQIATMLVNQCAEQMEYALNAIAQNPWDIAVKGEGLASENFITVREVKLPKVFWALSETPRDGVVSGQLSFTLVCFVPSTWSDFGGALHGLG